MSIFEQRDWLEDRIAEHRRQVLTRLRDGELTVEEAEREMKVAAGTLAVFDIVYEARTGPGTIHTDPLGRWDYR